MKLLCMEKKSQHRRYLPDVLQYCIRIFIKVVVNNWILYVLTLYTYYNNGLEFLYKLQYTVG